ncbi:MAG: hypothetical protein J5908_01775 [Selenomonas sp.]|nr:hypothetical protein [Selenomonas sp.]
MVKLYAAVVFAFIAATVIVITGLSSDARAITVFLRSIVGFISAGLVVYILLKVLAAQGIMDFDAFIEAKDEEALAELEGEESSAAGENTAEDESPETGEAKPAEKGEPAQFEPLSSDDLTRMETPE